MVSPLEHERTHGDKLRSSYCILKQLMTACGKLHLYKAEEFSEEASEGRRVE